MSKDMDECKEILGRAIECLIDLESGCFERLLMAAKEIFSLTREQISDDMVGLYLEFVGQFDREKKDNNQDFVWQNIADMEDEKKKELAEIILKLYNLACTNIAVVKERKRIAQRISEIQSSIYEELTS